MPAAPSAGRPPAVIGVDRVPARCPAHTVYASGRSPLASRRGRSRRPGSPGASPRRRRDRHARGLPRLPARHPGVEVLGAGRGGPERDGRRLVDDARRDAQAHGLRRGPLVLPVAARREPRSRRGTRWTGTADRDWDWHSAAEDSPDQLRALWQDAVDRSRALVAEALADGGLDQLAQRTWPDGRAPSLRWILVHMIEEYARHNGHADLLRGVGRRPHRRVAVRPGPARRCRHRDRGRLRSGSG